MGLDVIPREEETGEVIDPRTASIVNLYRVVCGPPLHQCTVVYVIVVLQIRKQSSLGIVESVSCL